MCLINILFQLGPTVKRITQILYVKINSMKTERFDCYYRMLSCFISQVFLRILKTHWIIYNSVSALLHYMTLECDVSIELKIN